MKKKINNKSPEYKVSEEENNLQLILELMQTGITIRDLNYVLIYQNNFIMNIFGDHIGEKCYQVFQNRNKPCEGCPAALVYKDGKSHTSIRKVKLPTGEISFWKNTANPIRDAEGKIVSCLEINTNITEYKKAEETLAKSNEELEQFAYIASHEIQEPLRVISSYCQLLEKDYKNNLDEEGKQYLTYIIDSSIRMKCLIRELLDFSRVGRKDNPFELVDLNKVIEEEIKQDFKISIKENAINIKYDKLPTIKCVKFRITQLFHNLISNSIKFRSDNLPLIEISYLENENCWEFLIEDNGIGINPKYFDKIFGIFKRLYTREQYPGTGIGLAICKKIVESHKGKIWVESKSGEGSKFYFTISKKL